MKTHNDSLKEEDIKAFKDFKLLWKTSDPDWIAERQAAWRTVYGDAEDPHTLFREKYYVCGEEPPSYIRQKDGSDQVIAFEYSDRVAYLPFESGTQVVDFWQATLGRYNSDFRNRHRDFLLVGNKLDSFPERDDMVKLITTSLFSSDYFMCPSDSKFVSEGTLETLNPRDFVLLYSRVRSFYKDSNTGKWDFRNFSFDYFMLSVRNCEETGSLSPHYESELLKMYRYLLGLDDSGLSEYRSELKQMLVKAAEDPDAPILLKDALNEARA